VTFPFNSSMSATSSFRFDCSTCIVHSSIHYLHQTMHQFGAQFAYCQMAKQVQL
jgi:hypothetical protein